MNYVLKGLRPMKILTSITLASCLMVIASGSIAAAQDKEDNKASHASHISFVKPGAAVSLDHDYDGYTEVGTLETVTLTVSHLYQSGSLSAKTLPMSGMDIISDTSLQKTQISTGSTLSIYVQFSALKAGSYALAVELIHEDGLGQQSRRTLSVPIQVGKLGDQTLSKADKPVERKVKLDGLIIMPAQENIR